MYICEIAIDNFKSFNGKTTVPFEKGFTTVSGPNGSGKSNIIDSILFCLALSTSRSMRAEKLTDLINNLSNRKTCEVVITFQKEPNELTADEKAALEAYAKKNDEEQAEQIAPDRMTVSRRIKVSNSGPQSVYALNGQTTTLSEIHDTLGRYHVSPGSFNVMMQGDVQGFVSMSPMERRKIIDEIAGVAEFDRKIDQAQKELERTGENIDRNTLLLQEIEERLGQLADERKTALKYQKMRDEKQALEAKQLEASYLNLKNALAATKQNIAETELQRQEARKKLSALVKQAAETRKALQRISEEVKKKGEDQHIALKTQIEGLKGHISRKEDAIRFNTEKILEHRQQIEQVELTITRQQDNIESLNNQCATLQQQIDELQPLFDKEKAEYTRLNTQMDAMTAESGELGVERARLRDAVRDAEQQVTEAQRAVMTLEGERHHLATTMAVHGEAAQTNVQRHQRLSAEQATVSHELESLETRRQTIDDDIAMKKTGLAEHQTALQQAMALFNRVNAEAMQLEAQKRAYDDMNYARPVEMIAKSGIHGIEGPLGQLLEVEADVATAIEVAMGGRIQHVVVDDDRVASEAITYLKQQRAGRATFLPLNKLAPPRRMPPIPRGQGIVDFAVNLVEYDRRFEAAFSYALGDTLIVEDMDAARPFLRKYRMVTLDGELLEKSGAMTGGSSASKSGQSRLSGAAKIETALADAEQKLKKANYQRQSLTKEVDTLALTLDALRQERAEAQETISGLRARLNSINEQLAELSDQQTVSDDSGDKLAALDKQLVEAKATLATVSATLAEVTGQRDALDAKLPTDEITALQQAMADVKFQMDYYDGQMRNVQSELQSKTLEKDYQTTGVTEYRQRIEDLKRQNAEMAKQSESAKEEIAITQQQITGLEAQTLELDDELKQLQAERDTVQNQLIEEEKAKSNCERDINQFAEQMTAFEERRQSLVPQVSEAYQVLLQAHNAWKAQHEATSISDADDESDSTDGVEDNVISMAVAHPDDVTDENLPSDDDVSQRIQRLEKRMQTLEPVNMRAIDDYAAVEERHGELKEKITTLANEREAITVRISGFEELKRSAFQKSFDEVDAHFRSIFEALAAGEGRLVLSNPDDPLNSGMTLMAQPRGKKMQRIEAMSGGEKSLTSLAFVFALQRTQPAPFYALDEVDMNLDGINVEKLANMIVNETEKGAQFLVVSLRKPMIERSARTIGVTQKQGGRTHVTGIRVRDAVKAADSNNSEQAADAPLERKAS
jgi:chromosome segregation protein